MTNRVGLPAVALLVLVAGCGIGGPDLALDGEWVLSGGTHDGVPIGVIEGTPVTLRIADDEVGGTAACNHYGGSLDRSGSQISIGALSMTEMGCDRPIADLEAAYLAALIEVRSATRVAGDLTLSGPGVELTFVLIPNEADAALLGTTWILESVVMGDAVASVAGEATIELAGDGTLAGSTGCRSFRARYEIDGDRLEVLELVSDRRACSNELGWQDGAVLDVLESGPRLTVDGHRLSLVAATSGLDYLALDE